MMPFSRMLDGSDSGSSRPSGSTAEVCFCALDGGCLGLVFCVSPLLDTFGWFCLFSSLQVGIN